MPTYLFELGHVPELSTAELETVFRSRNLKVNFTASDKNWRRVKTAESLPVAELMARLGGTVKILELVGPAPEPQTAIKNYLQSLPQKTGKLNFSISGTNAGRLAVKIKKLAADGRPVRYIKPKNTATVLHNRLVATATDLTLIDGELFVTRAIQPLEEFSARDYGRPASDAKSGMLPPKLARIMLNLSGALPDDALLDPFCGSGTILTEALSLGFKNIIGSDLSAKAVADSQKNVDWFYRRAFWSKTYSTSANNIASPSYISPPKEKPAVRLLQTDARDLHKKLPAHSVDVVVTEPHLGQPLYGRESQSFIKSQADELARLYSATFQSLANILKPQAEVVFIIPEFHLPGGVIAVNCLPNIKKSGFAIMPLSSQCESILYRRPGQLVGRRICKFIKAK